MIVFDISTKQRQVWIQRTDGRITDAVIVAEQVAEPITGESGEEPARPPVMTQPERTVPSAPEGYARIADGDQCFGVDGGTCLKSEFDALGNPGGRPVEIGPGGRPKLRSTPVTDEDRAAALSALSASCQAHVCEHLGITALDQFLSPDIAAQATEYANTDPRIQEIWAGHEAAINAAQSVEELNAMQFNWGDVI